MIFTILRAGLAIGRESDGEAHGCARRRHAVARAAAPARAGVRRSFHRRRRRGVLDVRPPDGDVDDAVAARPAPGGVEQPVAEAMQVARRADGEVADGDARRRHRLHLAVRPPPADLDVQPARPLRQRHPQRLLPVGYPLQSPPDSSSTRVHTAAAGDDADAAVRTTAYAPRPSGRLVGGSTTSSADTTVTSSVIVLDAICTRRCVCELADRKENLGHDRCGSRRPLLISSWDLRG